MSTSYGCSVHSVCILTTIYSGLYKTTMNGTLSLQPVFTMIVIIKYLAVL